MADQHAPSDGILSKPGNLNRARPGWYRGIRLQRHPIPPRIPLPLLKSAVRNAVRKNLRGLSEESNGKQLLARADFVG